MKRPSHSIKQLVSMKRNPRNEWTIHDVLFLCCSFGIDGDLPSNGSHYVVWHPGVEGLLTIPAKRPIKALHPAAGVAGRGCVGTRMNIQGYRVEVRELSAHLGGGFVSYAPELKGCVADGENRTDAVLNLEKAGMLDRSCARGEATDPGSDPC